MKNAAKYVIPFFGVFFVLLLFSEDLFSSLGFALFAFFTVKFYDEIGKEIEIRDIMILLAVLQWIIGPFLSYKLNPDDEFYYMAVPLKEYMSFVVPASYAFVFGLYSPIGKKYVSNNYIIRKTKALLKTYKNLDLYLIFFGIILRLTIDLYPDSLRFAFALLAYTRFIGLFFLLVSERKYKWLFISLIFLFLLVESLQESLFHDLLLWLGFFFLVYTYIDKPSRRKKLIFFFIGLFIAVSVQTVKYGFREAISEGQQPGIGMFFGMIQEKVFASDYVSSEANINAAVTRINQGWIIARIMSYTPLYEPYAEGETIKVAISASLLPRFLAPNKVKAGGRTYFERFTGKPISENTSMGLSLLGEAYANFGIFGGAFFMFIIGLFYNLFLVGIFRIAIKHPSIIFFIPLIFLQVIKAETDFSVILNHLVKASIVVWMIYFGLKQFFGVRL